MQGVQQVSKQQCVTLVHVTLTQMPKTRSSNRHVLYFTKQSPHQLLNV
jgi:hypothetical protein